MFIYQKNLLISFFCDIIIEVIIFEVKMKKRIIFIILGLIFGLCLCISTILIIQHIKIKQQESANLASFLKYYNEKVDSFKKENENIKNNNIDVDLVFLGDSITDNCDLNKYYSEYKAYNRGISGDTTTGLLNRMKESLYDINTKCVIMCIGGNNYKNMFDDYEDLLKGIKKYKSDCLVLIVSLPPLDSQFIEYNSYFIKNNERLKAYADAYNYIYVDIFNPLYDSSKKAVKDGMTLDGVHPSHDSYVIISNIIKDILKEKLN